jgi:hypothetical protein
MGRSLCRFDTRYTVAELRFDMVGWYGKVRPVSVRVPLKYWVTWFDLRLCSMVILADQASDDAFSADAA